MVRLAREHGRPADLGRWVEQRDRIYAQIMDRGWNPDRRAFTHLSLINAAISLDQRLDRGAAEITWNR